MAITDRINAMTDRYYSEVITDNLVPLVLASNYQGCKEE